MKGGVISHMVDGEMADSTATDAAVTESARPPLVSILINNYNYGRFLAEAIKSTLQQTYPEIEVIVVDDGSTDNSLEVLDHNKDNVKVIRSSNAGQAAAINMGFAASQGSIIWLLDADDTFAPAKVSKITETFGKSPEASWIFHGLTYVQSGTGEACHVDQPERTEQCDFRPHARGGMLPCIHSSTSGLSFRRNLFERIAPIPAEVRIATDNYLKFAAMALAEGVLLREPLSILRIRGANAYTMRSDETERKAEMKILTARDLRQRWPFLTRLANRLVADALSDPWRLNDRAKRRADRARNYLEPLAPWQRVSVYVMAARIALKNYYRKLLPSA